MLVEAGLHTYVITRPTRHEADLPPVFWWEGTGGAKVKVVRPEQYFGAPLLDASGLCLYGVGNHGGGPTLQHLREADDLCHRDLARHGSISSWAEGVGDDLPVVKGDLVHHARGCYAALVSFKERMRGLERRLEQAKAPIDKWEPLLFWQFHDVLAGSSIPEVYEEAEADLVRLDQAIRRPLPSPTPAKTFVPRHRVDEGRPVLARETLGQPWKGWVRVQWLCTVLPREIQVEGHTSLLRHVEQQGAGWRAEVLVHLTLDPNEERRLHWQAIPGEPSPVPPAARGIRLAVVEDGTDTWGHTLVRYGPEVEPGPQSVLTVGGGPDGLVEVFGDWFEKDRALKLVIPWDQVKELEMEHDLAESPGGEWEGPVSGRVWSYDTTGEGIRITVRRSPPYALHDPMQRVQGAIHRYTDQGRFSYHIWLSPQPSRVEPETVTL